MLSIIILIKILHEYIKINCKLSIKIKDKKQKNMDVPDMQ